MCLIAVSSAACYVIHQSKEHSADNGSHYLAYQRVAHNGEVRLQKFVTYPCACNANDYSRQHPKSAPWHDHLRQQACYEAYNDEDNQRLMRMQLPCQKIPERKKIQLPHKICFAVNL